MSLRGCFDHSEQAMNPTPLVPTSSTNYYCPYCKDYPEENAYDHTYEHMDIAPYWHLVHEEFWSIGVSAHVTCEGI